MHNSTGQDRCWENRAMTWRQTWLILPECRRGQQRQKPSADRGQQDRGDSCLRLRCSHRTGLISSVYQEQGQRWTRHTVNCNVTMSHSRNANQDHFTPTKMAKIFFKKCFLIKTKQPGIKCCWGCWEIGILRLNIKLPYYPAIPLLII